MCDRPVSDPNLIDDIVLIKNARLIVVSYHEVIRSDPRHIGPRTAPGAALAAIVCIGNKNVANRVPKSGVDGDLRGEIGRRAALPHEHFRVMVALRRAEHLHSFIATNS